MSISILPVGNNTQTKFKSAYSNSYKSIKMIKGAGCASCGKGMIDGLDALKAYSSISKPLSKMLQDGHFKAWLDKLPIWNVLVKFAQRFPNDSYDKIFLSSENNKELLEAIKTVLPVEDNNTLSKKIQKTRSLLTTDSRFELKSAKVVLKRFKTFRDKLKDNEKEIFDLLEYYAELNPRASLKEIINNKEILNFHKDIHIKHVMKTERIRNLHFNRIDKMIAKENPEAKEIFAEVREKGMQILMRDFDPEANLPNLKKLYKEALEQNGCERIIHKVMDELKEMPIKNLIADSFFGYAALKQFNDGEIIEHLIAPSIKTFEHIIAKSKGGKDKTSNGMLMCSQCNKARSSMPYPEFIEYHPYMPYYTQKQILYISNVILKNKAPFLQWPIRTANTLNECTDGKINPDLSSYCKKILNKFEKQQKERDEQIENYSRSIDASQKEVNELREKIRIINQDINATQEEVNDLKSKNGLDKKFQEEFDLYLENKKDGNKK